METNQFRRDPITGRWSIILTRTQGLQGLLAAGKRSRATKKHAPCKYCAGSEAKTPPEIFAIRNDGAERNGPDWQVRVLPYSEPFLEIHGDLNSRGHGMYDILDGIGAHEIVLESPVPDTNMHDMSLAQLQNVLFAYRTRILDLKGDPRFRYVMVHKHHGDRQSELTGHPHAHILATPITPSRVKSELFFAMQHYKVKERCLFCDVLFQELTDKERVIFENDDVAALSPFASRAPFSVWILPKKHEPFFEWRADFAGVAEAFQVIAQKMKKVLGDPPFIMVLHTGPNMATGQQRGYWKTLERDYHWFFEITPRFRSYTSFELGSGFQVNPVSPERATKILKEEKIV